MTTVAAVISAIAAAAATFFAWRALQQASEIRREDRRWRLTELVGDYSDTLLRVVNGARHETQTTLPVVRAKLAAAVAAHGESLPATDGLLALEISSAPDVVQFQTALALDELAGVEPFEQEG